MGIEQDFFNKSTKEGSFSSQEKLYMDKNYFLSNNEIKNNIDVINKFKEGLKKENGKSFWNKDKKIVNDFKEKIKKNEDELLKQKEFLLKQEAFLSTHPSVNLENKNQEEIIHLLIQDPQLVHCVWGIYEGLGLEKTISGDKSFIKTSHPFGLSILPKCGDFRGLSPQKRDSLYENRRYGNSEEVRAIPAFFNKPEGKGFGIVWPSKDHVGRPGYASFWTIVSKYDKKIQEYLTQNPEVLLKIFIKEFKEQARNPREGISSDYSDKLKLASKEFIDVDSEN
ncbi:MAG: hypothetical protein WC662_03640 [Candidatus Paceibacterota bacterium]|jgi:hypothetical protein